jgi:hypothetical protein
METVIKVKPVKDKSRIVNFYSAFYQGRNSNKFTIEEDPEFNKNFKDAIIKEHGNLKDYFYGYSRNDRTHPGKQVALEPTTRIFNLTDKDSEDYLDYLILKNHPFIGHNLSDAKSKNAKFYILNEEKEAEVRNEYRSMKRRAFAKTESLTPDKKRGLLRMLGKATNGLSDVLVDDIINQLCEDSPSKVIDYLDDKKFEMRTTISEYIEFKIITIDKSGNYKYADHLWRDMDGIIQFLEIKENRQYIDVWEKQLMEMKDPRPKDKTLLD